MSDGIKVSVICIAYNQISYIEKMLDSVVSQKTNFRFEVIVHDDASTDGTADVIRSFSERYHELIIPILQVENQYSKNVKVAFSLLPKARGEYLAFCEGDDYWCDTYKLQKQFDAMESNPNCSMCVHKTQNINENGSIHLSVQGDYKDIHEGLLDSETICKLFLKKPTTIFHTSSFFIRLNLFRDIYLSQPEFIKYATGGDQVILRVCMTVGSYYYIDEIMTCYRKFAKGSINSVSKTAKPNYWKQYYSRYAVGNLLFDKFSNYRFHKYVRGWIGINIMNLGRFDAIEAKKLLREYDIHLKDLFITHNFKYYIKYLGLVLFPILCMFLYKCKYFFEKIKL